MASTTQETMFVLIAQPIAFRVKILRELVRSVECLLSVAQHRKLVLVQLDSLKTNRLFVKRVRLTALNAQV